MKTEEFHKFHRSVRNAQEEYLKQVIKFEVENEVENQSLELTEQPSFVEVITNYDDLNEFADECTTKPETFQNESRTKTEHTDVLRDETIVVTNTENGQMDEDQLSGKLVQYSHIY